jgi:hypothetical protein
MAYNGYFPTGYQPYYPQYQAAPQVQQPQQQNGNGIIWVQGLEGAKSYLVAAGSSVLLMDSEESVFYIKSTDQSGMPQPLRIFDYTERTAQHSEAGITKKPDVDYVSRSEFEEFREDVKRSIKGIRRPRIEEDEE